MGTSVLASASESACEYKYSLLHSIKLVVYIFVKHVIISNKVVNHRLEACDFVRKCLAKISRIKFFNDLKRATAQNLCGKAL